MDENIQPLIFNAARVDLNIVDVKFQQTSSSLIHKARNFSNSRKVKYIAESDGDITEINKLESMRASWNRGEIRWNLGETIWKLGETICKSI